MIEEISIKSKPLWLQFAFIFIWMALIVFLGSLGNEENESLAVSSMTPGLMRLSTFIQDILIFIVPVLFFVYIFREEKFSFLTLNKKLYPLQLLSLVLVIFFSLPLIAWLGDFNSGFKMPASLLRLENWMKAKELSAGKLTELLLSDKSISGFFLNLFIMAFLAAFSEELFFRAIIQKLLIQTKMNYHIAIWTAALIFSAFHLQFYGFLPRAALGACIGYLFYFSGNLWVSIIAHFLNNALYIIIAYLSSDLNTNSADQNLTGNGSQMSWPIVTLSLLLIFGVFMILNKIKEKENISDA